MTGADAVIVVTPIFSASYSGLFKTFFDVIEPDALAGKPVLIGATGGTARHSLALEYALRPLFTYLHAVVVPTAVYAAPRTGGARAPGADRPRRQRAGRADTRTLRGVDGRCNLDDVVPFADMLAAQRP